MIQNENKKRFQRRERKKRKKTDGKKEEKKHWKCMCVLVLELAMSLHPSGAILLSYQEGQATSVFENNTSKKYHGKRKKGPLPVLEKNPPLPSTRTAFTKTRSSDPTHRRWKCLRAGGGIKAVAAAC